MGEVVNELPEGGTMGFLVALLTSGLWVPLSSSMRKWRMWRRVLRNSGEKYDSMTP